MEIRNTCMMCQRTFKIDLTEEEANKYINDNRLIQEVFPKMNPAEREFLITGYCLDCQAMIFGSNYKSDRIVKVEI